MSTGAKNVAPPRKSPQADTPAVRGGGGRRSALAQNRVAGGESRTLDFQGAGLMGCRCSGGGGGRFFRQAFFLSDAKTRSADIPKSNREPTSCDW